MKRYYRKNLKSIICFAAVNLLAAVSSVFLAYLLGFFADNALNQKLEHMWLLVIGTVFYIGIDIFLNYLMEYTKARAIHRIGKDMRSDTIRKIERLSFEEKRKQDDGYFLSLINNDIPTVEEEYLDSAGAIYYQICCFGIAIAAALSIQPVMTIIMLVVSVIPVLFPKLSEKPLQRSKEAEQNAKTVYMGSVTQILKGFSFLRNYQGFAGFNRIHDRKTEDLRDRKTKYSKMKAALYAGAFGCGNLIFLGTWVVGLFFVRKDFITLPALITFSQLMTFVAGPIQIISERYSSTIAASAVCKRILDFTDNSEEEEIRWGDTSLNHIDEIALHTVNIFTEEKTLLRDVDLVLHKGDRVALMGESGSGKSTLLYFLAALHNGSGSYTINGKDFSSYSYNDFRKRVNLLEQKSFVFDASIRDNLTMFGTETDDGKLQQILTDVGLAKWFKSRGDSLETRIGTEQTAMSGGEERRLNLGRTMLRQEGLIMLDEPTTGLDEESRLFVEKTIRQMECDILITTMHEYSPEFLGSFNRVFIVKDGTVRERV